MVHMVFTGRSIALACKPKLGQGMRGKDHVALHKGEEKVSLIIDYSDYWRGFVGLRTHMGDIEGFCYE